METEDINPLQLTLDEVIKLNKLRNDEKKQNASTSSVVVKDRTNGVVHDDDDDIVANGIKSENESNGRIWTGQIYDRLGWKKRPQGLLTRKQRDGTPDGGFEGLRHVQNNFKRPQRVVKNYKLQRNTLLTKDALLRQSRNLGNFAVRRVSNTPRPAPAYFRHSTNRFLEPEIQMMLQGMLNNGKPAIVNSDRGTVIDHHDKLLHFQVRRESTDLPTFRRIENNG